jgi:hypothetical protein
MRIIQPVLVLLAGFLMSCQSSSTSNMPENAGKSESHPAGEKPLRIEEGNSMNYAGMVIKIERIADVFLQSDIGFSEQTHVAVTVKKDGKTVKWDAVYGSVTNVFGYYLKVKYCATGTSDWKSFAEFLVTPVK